MNLLEFRQKYPQYDKVDDETLSRKIYEEYYTHTLYKEFLDKFSVLGAEDAPSSQNTTPLNPADDATILTKLDLDVSPSENLDPDSDYQQYQWQYYYDKLSGNPQPQEISYDDHHLQHSIPTLRHIGPEEAKAIEKYTGDKITPSKLTFDEWLNLTPIGRIDDAISNGFDPIYLLPNDAKMYSSYQYGYKPEHFDEEEAASMSQIRGFDIFPSKYTWDQWEQFTDIEKIEASLDTIGFAALNKYSQDTYIDYLKGKVPDSSLAYIDSETADKLTNQLGFDVYPSNLTKEEWGNLSKEQKIKETFTKSVTWDTYNEFQQKRAAIEKAMLSIMPEPEFEQRMPDVDRSGTVTNVDKVSVIKNKDGSVSSHLVAWGEDDEGFYVFPTIVKRKGQLEQLSVKEADEYAHKTGQLKRFPTQQEAEAYAAGGWKKPTKKEEITIQPAVQKPLSQSLSEKLSSGKTTKISSTVFPANYRGSLRRKAEKAVEKVTAPDQAVSEPLSPDLIPITTDSQQSLIAGKEPGIVQKAKEFISEKTGLLKPDISPRGGRKYREEQPFKTVGAFVLRQGAAFASGRGLFIPDVIAKYAKGDNTAEESIDRMFEFSPTKKEKQMGEILKFFGAARSVGKIASKLGLMGNLPKSLTGRTSVAQAAKIIEAGKLGILLETPRQVSKLITGNPDYEGAIAPLKTGVVLAGLQFLAIGAVAPFKSGWDKLYPSEQAKALKWLGLKQGATDKEIHSALRGKYHQFHEDKATKQFAAEFNRTIQARDTLLKQTNAEDIVLRRQAPKQIAGETAVTHKMPDGTVMAGPEHPGAVPGSTQPVTTSVRGVIPTAKPPKPDLGIKVPPKAAEGLEPTPTPAVEGKVMSFKEWQEYKNPFFYGETNAEAFSQLKDQKQHYQWYVEDRKMKLGQPLVTKKVEVFTHKDGSMNIIEKPNMIILGEVKVAKKGRGTGTEMVKRAITYIQEKYPNKPIHLLAITDRNFEWYKKLGFTSIPGEGEGFAGMVYNPSGKIAPAPTPAGEGERIAAVATRITETGKVFTSDTTHAETTKQALDSLDRKRTTELDEEEGLEQGFTTNTGRFVSRKEALDIAERAEQKPLPRLSDEKELDTSLLRRKALAQPTPTTTPAGEGKVVIDAKNSIRQRGVKGDDLLNAEDRIDEVLNNDKTAEIDNQGFITLYHRTTAENAKNIIETGVMKKKETSLFFGTKPEGQISGYGDAVIKVRVPIENTEINDIFTNEVHLTIPGKNLKDVLIKAEATGKAKDNTRPGFARIPEVKDFQKVINDADTGFRNLLQYTELEPSKIVEKTLGKAPYAEVIKGIHKTDVARAEFQAQKAKDSDKTLEVLAGEFSKYPDSVLNDLMSVRGKGLTGKAKQIQTEAYNRLPEELKDPKILRAIQQVADNNYKYLQQVVGDDIDYVKDYFYGIYKNPEQVDRFLSDYRQTTQRFTKQKKLPTYADARAYGLEIRDPNPIHNLQSEYIAIAHLDGMKGMKEQLLNIGKGKYIWDKDTAPLKAVKVNDPMFKDVLVDPDLGKLINNLIATNKITQMPLANALRTVNNYLRTLKFAGSAFHMISIAKQAVADSGYLGFYKPTARRGFTTGFKKDDPKFQLPAYKNYLLHGGGHRYSVESEAARAFKQLVFKANTSSKALLRAGGLAIKIPSGFANWMFNSYIPDVKFAKYMDTVAEQERKLKRPLTSPEIIEIIKEQNNFYGMMNERLFGRSGTVTSALRFYFMSPGYAEGNYRTMIKAATQWGGKEGFSANRSRSNIVNSWIISGIASAVGTMIMTGKPPKKPETLDDFRDLFKVDTGKVDEKDRKIMIDMLTYDKDYFNVAFNTLRLQPGKAINESITRIGGMKATTGEIIWDMTGVLMGHSMMDWKGDKVYFKHDKFLEKVYKGFVQEIKKLPPISVSVFQQARKRQLDKGLAAFAAMAGVRITYTETEKRKRYDVNLLYSVNEEEDELSYRLGKSDNPREYLAEYNKTARDILDAVSPALRKVWEPKLIKEYDKVVLWKKFPIDKMTKDELQRSIKKHTYVKDQKQMPNNPEKWRAHSNWADRVTKMKEAAGMKESLPADANEIFGFSLKGIATPELLKDIKSHTYKKDWLQYPNSPEKWRPHKNWEGRIKDMRTELNSRK